jgi:hypothetical protein
VTRGFSSCPMSATDGGLHYRLIGGQLGGLAVTEWKGIQTNVMNGERDKDAAPVDIGTSTNVRSSTLSRAKASRSFITSKRGRIRASECSKRSY